MTMWSRVRSGCGPMLRGSRMESEMDAERRFHIEAYAEDLIRSGVRRTEAMWRARMDFVRVPPASLHRRSVGLVLDSRIFSSGMS